MEEKEEEKPEKPEEMTELRRQEWEASRVALAAIGESGRPKTRKGQPKEQAKEIKWPTQP